METTDLMKDPAAKYTRTGGLDRALRKLSKQAEEMARLVENKGKSIPDRMSKEDPCLSDDPAKRPSKI